MPYMYTIPVMYVSRVQKVLWAHLGHSGSHRNSLSLRKAGTSPSGALLRKKPLFSMAQWLDPWILNAKDAKAAKGATHKYIYVTQT